MSRRRIGMVPPLGVPSGTGSGAVIPVGGFARSLDIGGAHLRAVQAGRRLVVVALPKMDHHCDHDDIENDGKNNDPRRRIWTESGQASALHQAILARTEPALRYPHLEIGTVDRPGDLRDVWHFAAVVVANFRFD